MSTRVFLDRLRTYVNRPPVWPRNMVVNAEACLTRAVGIQIYMDEVVRLQLLAEEVVKRQLFHRHDKTPSNDIYIACCLAQVTI